MWQQFKHTLTFKEICKRPGIPTVLILPTLLTAILPVVCIISTKSTIVASATDNYATATVTYLFMSQIPAWTTHMLAAMPYMATGAIAASICSVIIALIAEWATLKKIIEVTSTKTGSICKTKKGFWLLTEYYIKPKFIRQEIILQLGKAGIHII